MNIPEDSRFLDDPQFQSLLVSCMESLQRGEEIDRESLANDYPQFADELQQFLDDRELLQNVASGFVNVEAAPSSAFEKTVASGGGHDDFSDGEQIRYVGEYEIVDEIARGGMGVVFKARQQSLKRIVALKMILAGRLADNADVERFHREAQAAGRLNHRHIVAVHEVGEHDGRHYFTMDFVDGRSLSDVIRDAPLASQRAARIVRQVAEAVEFAHQQGTLHRDLKPANVLMTADDVPHVTDFGLAKMLDRVDDNSRAELTASGQILGTPSHMSPEQAAGKQALVGVASDVYSLGSTLYACLTGRAPFVADSPVDTLLQVMHKEPVSPRLLNPTVPKDLETICLKCLNKEPHRRYGTAQLFADDLGRFLEGRPVLARPVSATLKLIRWAKRNRMVAALIVLSVMLLAAGTAVSTYFAIEASKRAEAEGSERRRADHTVDLLREASRETSRALGSERRALAETQEERDEAQRQRERAEQLLYAAQINGALLSCNAGDVPAARDLLNACRWDLTGWEHQYLTSLLARTDKAKSPGAPKSHENLDQLGDMIHRMAISPTGEFVVIIEAAEKEGETRPEIRVHEFDSGRLLHTLSGHTTGVMSVAWSSDGRRIVSGAKDGEVRIWDARSGNEMARRAGRGNPMSGVAFSPDGRRVLCGGGYPAFPPGPNKDPELWVLDASTGAVVWELHGHKAAVIGVSFSLDGRWMASVGSSQEMLQPGDIRVWNAETGEQVYRIDGPPMEAISVAFSPDSQRFVVAGGVGAGPNGVSVYQTSSGERLAVLRGQHGTVSSVKFSPDGTRIAGCAFELDPRVKGSEVVVWHAATGVQLLTLKLNDRVGEVQWTPDSHALVGSGLRNYGGQAAVWEAAIDPVTPAVIRDGFASAASCLAFGPDDSTLASGGADSIVRIWNLQTGRQSKSFTSDRGPIVSVAYGPFGRRIVSGAPGRLVMWDVTSGREIFRAGPDSLIFHAVAISPDGRLFASGGSQGRGRVWKTDRGQIVCTLSGSKATIRDVVFSPDSRLVATASHDKVARIFDVVQGDVMTTLTGHSGVVDCVAFAPDGKRLVTGSFDKTLKIWDAITGRELHTLKGHSGSVLSVAFSGDGKHIVSGSTDKTVRLWNPDSGTLIKTLAGHEFYVRSVAFSPGGSRIASSSGIEDMTIRIWPIPTPNREP